MNDRDAFKHDLTTALGRDVPAAELGAVVSKHLPDVDVFRENDDLIIVSGETRRLLVRRVGPERFVTSDHAAARVHECPRFRRRIRAGFGRSDR